MNKIQKNIVFCVYSTTRHIKTSKQENLGTAIQRACHN